MSIMPKNVKSKRSNNNKNNSRKRQIKTFTPTTFSLFGHAPTNRIDGRTIASSTRSSWADLPVTISSNPAVGNGISFNLTGFYLGTTFYQWKGTGDFTDNYDFYQLDRVNISFIFCNNMSNTTSTATQLPILFTCVDYNDAAWSSSTSLADISNRSTARMVLCGPNEPPHVLSFTPRVMVNTYSTALTNGYMEAPLSAWYSTANNTGAYPVHYGAKFAVDTSFMTGSTGLAIGNFRVFVKGFYSFRDPR
jgi:hypothetical protein